MHDAITLERLQRPAAAVLTEPFVPTGRTLAAALGLPDYPLCIISHPISSDDEATLLVKARSAAAQIAAILTGSR